MSTKALLDDKELQKSFDQVMDVPGFLGKIDHFLEKFSDKDYLEHIKQSAPGAEKYYGVPVPVLRALAKRTGIYCRNNPDVGVVLLRKMWERNSREDWKIVSEALAFLFKVNGDKALELIMEFLPDVNNWETCDTLACTALKPHTLKHPDMHLRMVNAWIKSPNPWVRRFGIVSLIPLSHLEAVEDLDFYLVILKRVMKDPSENVQKAAAWLLREITYKDPQRVADFLEVFAKNPDSSACRIIREGSRKFKPEVRDSIMEMIE